MKKKDRRKLKEFTQSEEWKNATKEMKISFVKNIFNSNEFTIKERKQVCKKLLSVL